MAVQMTTMAQEEVLSEFDGVSQGQCGCQVKAPAEPQGAVPLSPQPKTRRRIATAMPGSAAPSCDMLHLGGDKKECVFRNTTATHKFMLFGNHQKA